MQWGGFVVDCEGLTDQLWLLLEDLLDLRDVFLLDVPEEVLVPSVSMGDTLDCSHQI